MDDSHFARFDGIQQDLMLRIERSPHEGFLRETGAMLDQFPHSDIPVPHILVDDRFKSVLVEDMQRHTGDPALLPRHDLRDLVPAHHAFIATPRKSRKTTPFQHTETILVDENSMRSGHPPASFITYLESSDPPPETHSVAPSVSFNSALSPWDWTVLFDVIDVNANGYYSRQ